MANKKVHSFWSEIKKIKGKSYNLPLSVDGVSRKSNIANLLSEKYKKLFSSASYDKVQMSQIKQKHRKYTGSVLCNCTHGSCYNKHCISVSDICYSIKQLKHDPVN